MGRLIRLEIENFKSYKGHQTIGPFHKFTSVIGPNGSGKSNLMDAISFVLGVHSSHLRSQTLKDMIYRSSALSAEGDEGSSAASTRPPRRAYVMLAYENAQGREIRFMRTINHNGQSEYRINDKQVPYSQYNAALEKENILVKAKNFLVFQGDVESVASQNPKDLTKLIEQISGSWEYKEEYDRLKLAQDRAIENSAHAFNKKRGVTSEIKQYQEQKKEAEKFEALVRERRDTVVQYLLWKLFHVEQHTAALEEEANQKRVAMDDANEEQRELEQEFRNARKQQALAHRERTRTELQIKKLKKTLKDERPSSINIDEKIAHLKKKLEQTKISGERVKRDHDQQVQAVEDLKDSLSKLNEAIQNYEASLPKKELAKGPVLNAEQIAEYERLKQQVSIRAVAEQQNLENLQRRYKLEQENEKRLSSKLEELETRKKQLLETQSELQEHQESLKLDTQRMQEQLQARKEELLSLEQERKDIHIRETDLNEKLQDVLVRLMEAKVDQRESEKETRFNECLVMMKQIFPGVHGRLSELCRPTQRKYDVAVATTLGRNMDSIVVDDQKTAIECIHYMRDHHVGTATFLPLSTISAAPVNDRFRNYARGARLAVDIIESDRKYENVVRYACGNTLVCDTMQIAKQICYDQNENVRAVTLEGTVIHASGLITGGQSGNQARPRWQDQDLEVLIKTRDKLLAELGELNKKKRYGSAEEAAKSDCAGLESRLAVLEKEMVVTQQKLQDVQAEGRHVESELVNSELPRKQVQEKLKDLRSNIERVKASVSTVEDEIFADFCSRIDVQNIREYESLHFDLSAEVTEQRAAFVGQKSRLETQLSFETEQLSELGARLQNMEQTFKVDTEALQQLELESSNLAERIEKTKQELDTLNHDLEQKSATEEEKRQTVEELRRKLEGKGHDVESYLKEIGKFEAEIEKVSAERVAIFRKCKLEDIELPLSRGSMEDVIMDDATLGSQTQNNTLSSSMDLDEPSQLSIRSADWTVEVDYSMLPEELRRDGGSAKDNEFKEEIKRLGMQIDEMAPNLKAIDRLDGVESRLRDVEESFDTARRAAKRAKDEFNAVKRERYKRFYDAFSHISERIDQVYKELTKDANAPQGGTAYLTLEDNDEPYLQGIKYHVTPPTKRFRDMDELSGGEKSIAALALLLAIHSYQPSPFFVLDEVDAALDNINVTKIAAYIREHASEDFQFIVISLKSSLYEKAESLVGIYRDQDINSSKTLTLKLDEYQE